MAVNSGWITALASGASAATASTATPQQQAQQGAQAQAIASGINTLGDLAMAATKARMLKADAAGERVAGERRADRIRKAGGKAVGELRSAAVASGVKLSSTSVLDAEEDLTRNVEQDAGIAILTGSNRARSTDLSAEMLQAGVINSTISGGFDAYGKWKRSRSYTPSNIPAAGAPVAGIPNDRGDY